MSKTKVYTRYMFLFLLLLASSVGAMATADRVVVTSGRVVYDAFGRVVKVYHVMLRGIDRQDIFADDQDRGKLHQKNRPYFHSKKETKDRKGKCKNRKAKYRIDESCSAIFVSRVCQC